MPKAHYEVYRAQVLTLANTLVIKSLATAFTINYELTLLGYEINEAYPESWKYYVNLAGRYHAADTMMTVKSLDTLQTIDFTLENLQIHRATKEAYQYGSRYYKELVNRYPTQEGLIQRILNPVDMAVAIAANDAQILFYDTDLIEENETNLIPNLQSWINNVYSRWNVAAYQMTDELYAGSFIGILAMFIPVTIMNLRVQNCHTRFAHSFHIREFLISHGKLDPYIDFLTKKQSLWLYRNIRYILRNAGKQDTMDWLTLNILTERSLPLAKWDMVHNLAKMPDELYPELEFVRTDLNNTGTISGEDTRTLVKMLDAEQPAAPGNADVQPDAEVSIKQTMETSISNFYPTKVLESETLDMKGSAPFTFHDFILNHWLYLSQIGLYTSYVTFDDPRSGESTSLPVKDAFIIWLYAVNRMYGNTLPLVPTLQADMVRRVPTPSKADLLSVIDTKYAPEIYVDTILNQLPPVLSSISIAGFRENMLDCYDALMGQWFLWSSREHYITRGEVEVAALRLYCDYTCNLADEQPYTAWFEARQYSYDTYTDLECTELAALIWTQATGSDLIEDTSLAAIQEALIKLMSKLSSYNVQFLRSVNTDTIKVYDWAAIRAGDMATQASIDDWVNPIDLTVIDINEHSYAGEVVELNKIGAEITFDEGDSSLTETDLLIKPEDHTHVTVSYHAPLLDIGVISIEEPANENLEGATVRDTPEYIPLENPELADAFITLTSDQYFLTTSNRNSIEARWAEYLADPTIAVGIAENVTIRQTPDWALPPLYNLNTSVIPGAGF